MKVMKVLGLNWNKKEDCLSLKKIKQCDVRSITKRIALKQVVMVFDPLGLFSPLVLRGKLLLQILWTKHSNWDKELNKDNMTTWVSILQTLNMIADVTFPRCLKMEGASVTNSLVCFCDASSKAYAAVVYLVQGRGCDIKSDIILSKTRLSPTSKTTTHRLELMAKVIGVRCLNFVNSQIKQTVSAFKLFTDSQCTLKWLESKKQLPVFIRNRIQEIKKSKKISFQFVKSKENSADLASRGCTMDELVNNNLEWT